MPIKRNLGAINSSGFRNTEGGQETETFFLDLYLQKWVGMEGDMVLLVRNCIKKNKSISRWHHV